MTMRSGFVIFSLTLLLLTGCNSVQYNSTNSPHMIVAVEKTPFFHHGPMQGNGPDGLLPKGCEVDVLSKDMGFSYVRTQDGQLGYVDNEALASAPALPPLPTPTPDVSANTESFDLPVASNSAAAPTFRY